MGARGKSLRPSVRNAASKDNKLLFLTVLHSIASLHRQRVHMIGAEAARIVN